MAAIPVTYLPLAAVDREKAKNERTTKISVHPVLFAQIEHESLARQLISG